MTAGPRILVVDDDPSLRELLRLHLEAAGYRVELAVDAIEAGYAILRSPPDLLVVDVRMPHMSGIDLVATVIADATIPAFPFIFLSSDETRMERGQQLGAASYLLKPIVADRLLEGVARALRRARPQREEFPFNATPDPERLELRAGL
jgi:DNA-binding response OmpR family regulator